MFIVTGIRANRNPDARAEFLDQFTQEVRVAVVKPLDIDWISDRSTPSPSGLLCSCNAASCSSRLCSAAGAHRP